MGERGREGERKIEGKGKEREGKGKEREGKGKEREREEEREGGRER